MPTSFTSFNDGDVIQDEHVEQYATPINNIENGASHYGVGTSGNDTYTVTLTPTPPGTLAAGFWFNFKADVANTGACTMTVNGGSGAKSIKTKAGADPADNDILANGIYLLVYDGTNFQIVA